jgi:glycosyltransferase involved in cell wall biosynthesis
MLKNKLVSIIIPAYNEEKNLAGVIAACKKLKNRLNIEIIVVEGGSKDKTIEVAKKAKVDRVMSFPRKRGKGADFWAGVLASNGDYVVQIDSDHQFQPYEIPLFINALENGSDVVIGTRFNGGKVESGSVTSRNLIGNQLMSFATSIATGWKITDVMAGFKAFKRNAILAIDLKEPHFEYEAETVVKAKNLNLKLVELPITYKNRVGGTSGIRAIQDGLRVLSTIGKYRFFHSTKPVGI